MPKTKSINPDSKRGLQLKEKHQRIDVFAQENMDREQTYQYAVKQGLNPDQVAQAIARNFSIDGAYDPR